MSSVKHERDGDRIDVRVKGTDRITLIAHKVR